jgi:aspartate kinase
MDQNTIVMKFGGASVASPAHFANLADLIIARQQEYANVIVVVSAMGDSTDQLITLAKQVNPSPPQREYDMLVSVGERISISLLAMALAAKGCEANSFTGSQSGIITCSSHSDARIIDVRPHRLHKCLEENKIAIVAGFQGVSRDGDITTLGRGGSDITAVALGIALKASAVEFFKDVEGIYDRDPNKHPHEAKLFPELSYDEAAAIVCAPNSHQVLHARCLALAKQNLLPLHVLHYQFAHRKRPGTVIKDIHSIAINQKSSQPTYE